MEQKPSGFRELLGSMMKRRWYITALVLGSFVIIIGGIFGAIMTGIFVSPALGGTGVYDYVANKVGEFDMHTQVMSQLWAVGTAIVVSATVSYVALKLIDLTIGLRVKPDAEREGLDIAEHGEQAYHK